jgi:hypothetical protein
MLPFPGVSLFIASSQSGKSTQILKIVEDLPKFYPNANFASIKYHYRVYQDKFDRYKHFVDFIKGLPALEDVNSDSENDSHQLLVIDDLFPPQNKQEKELFEQLSTVFAHHGKITSLITAHNLFDKNLRLLSLNANLIALAKNVRDSKSVRYFAGQAYYQREKVFLDAFEKATREPYSFLYFSLSPKTPEHLRLFSHIFDPFPKYYIPSNIKFNDMLKIYHNDGSS